MKEESNPMIDPELEARIVALVLGEASDFERDELDRLIRERPDLAAFKEEMENISKLLEETVALEEFGGGDDWKLPERERSEVLAALDDDALDGPEIFSIKIAEPRSFSIKRSWWWNASKLAAVISLVGLGIGFSLPAITKRRVAATGEAPAPMLLKDSVAFYESFDEYSLAIPEEENVSDRRYFKGSFESGAEDVDGLAIRPEFDMDMAMSSDGATVLDAAQDSVDFRNGSKAALSAIQDQMNIAAIAAPEGSRDAEVGQQIASGLNESLEGLEKSRIVLGGEVNSDSKSRVARGRSVESAGSVALNFFDESELQLDAAATRNHFVSPKSQVEKSVELGESLSFQVQPGREVPPANAPFGGVASAEDFVESDARMHQWMAMDVPRAAQKAESKPEAAASSSRVSAGFSVAGKPPSRFDVELESPASDMPAVPAVPAMPSQEFLGDLTLPRSASGGEQFSPRWRSSGEANNGLFDSRFGDVTRGQTGQQQGRQQQGGQQQGNAQDGSQAQPQSGVIRGFMRPQLGAYDDNAQNGRDYGYSAGAMSGGAMGGGGFGGGAGGRVAGSGGAIDDLFGGAQDSSGTDGYASAADKSKGLGAVNRELSRGEAKNESAAPMLGLQLATPSPSGETSSGPVPSYALPADESLRGANDPTVKFSPPAAPLAATAIPNIELKQAAEGEQRLEELEEMEQPNEFAAGVRDQLSRLNSQLSAGRQSNVASDRFMRGKAAADFDQNGALYGEEFGESERVSRRNTKARDKELEAADVAKKNNRWDDSGVQQFGLTEGFKQNRGGSVRYSWDKSSEVTLSDEVSKDSWGAAYFGRLQGLPVDVKKFQPPKGLNEIQASDEAFSTFSLHVSDVSFKLARTALAQGKWPEKDKIRIEEFVNAFDYGDPLPDSRSKVACRLEQAVHPFLQQRNVMRVSMRTAAAGRAAETPLRLTFLLDNSGSMERPDRRDTVRRAFALLAQQLKPIDRVTLISFARQPRLLADQVEGTKAAELIRRIEALPSEGGTNVEGALRIAFEKAKEQQVEGAQNRIVLLTDGAVNLGNADPESLSQMVQSMRGAGIAFDAAGISADGLNDEILEALTRKGDGRYYLLDSVDDADEGFVRQIAGALRPSAKNVKVQVEFNPDRVGSYKLLGFEKHRLKKEDFRNDKVDAAEMAAEEAGVAVYQFEAKPDGVGDVGSVSVRFQDLSTGQMIEKRWPIPYQPDTERLDQSASSMQIASIATLFAAKLRGEPLGETVDLTELFHLISSLPDPDRNAPRVQELQTMIQQARQLTQQ